MADAPVPQNPNDDLFPTSTGPILQRLGAIVLLAALMAFLVYYFRIDEETPAAPSESHQIDLHGKGNLPEGLNEPSN